jgi:hypothetical protein
VHTLFLSGAVPDQRESSAPPALFGRSMHEGHKENAKIKFYTLFVSDLLRDLRVFVVTMGFRIWLNFSSSRFSSEPLGFETGQAPAAR